MFVFAIGREGSSNSEDTYQLMNLLTTNKIGKEEDERWSGESQSTEEGGVLIEQGNISSNVSLSPYQSMA